LDIQSDQLARFDDEDQRVLQTLANQIAIAIRNARLCELEKKLNADKD
jgi:GAF domain-containing protein